MVTNENCHTVEAFFIQSSELFKQTGLPSGHNIQKSVIGVRRLVSVAWLGCLYKEKIE